MEGHLTQAQNQSPASSTAAARVADAVVDAWWSSILAGDVDEPHPLYGPAMKVHLDGSRLRLSGELESAEDRKELIRQARLRVGHGIDKVDASDLRIARREEQPGVLDQTVISAFPNRAAAEYARAFVIKHSRVEPKHHEILVHEMLEDEEGRWRELLPADLVVKARKWLEAGQALLILTVDETAAHRVRELLEEDTRSQWTIAAPPILSESTR
jgi:hypothetical protein